MFGPKITAFLAAMRVMPSVARAAEAAGINPWTHYNKLKTSEQYREAFEDAQRAGFDALSGIAVERAQVGWDEPIVYQGNFCYPDKWDEEDHRWTPDLTKPPLTMRKIDNRLVEFVLKNRHPEYRERTEVTGKGGGPIQVQKFSGGFEDLLSLYKQVQAE